MKETVDFFTLIIVSFRAELGKFLKKCSVFGISVFFPPNFRYQYFGNNLLNHSVIRYFGISTKKKGFKAFKQPKGNKNAFKKPLKNQRPSRPSKRLSKRPSRPSKWLSKRLSRPSKRLKIPIPQVPTPTFSTSISVNLHSHSVIRYPYQISLSVVPKYQTQVPIAHLCFRD